VIDKDNCPGKLQISQQQQRLGVQLAKQKQSGSVHVDSLSSSSAFSKSMPTHGILCMEFASLTPFQCCPRSSTPAAQTQRDY
jgi:hypothetical protein